MARRAANFCESLGNKNELQLCGLAPELKRSSIAPPQCTAGPYTRPTLEGNDALGSYPVGNGLPKCR